MKVFDQIVIYALGLPALPESVFVSHLRSMSTRPEIFVLSPVADKW